MVMPIGWGETKPYWWCDTVQTRSVQDHLWNLLVHHPENGIYIKGIEKGRPESIEINTVSGSELLNINTSMKDETHLLETIEAIRIVMDSAVIDRHLYTFRSEEYFKTRHTYNLQYIWQQLEKKSKPSAH